MAVFEAFESMDVDPTAALIHIINTSDEEPEVELEDEFEEFLVENDSQEAEQIDENQEQVEEVV